MKSLFSRAALISSLLFSSHTMAAEYLIDTQGAHASINFEVPHLGYSFIAGRFNQFEGSFNFDPNKISDSSVTVTVQTKSLDSAHAERDKHIRSADFIDASQYPTATFVSKKVTDLGKDAFTIQGDLTLHGVTKPITIDAKLIGEGEDPWGGYRAGFMGTTRLELKDFGIAVMGPSSYVDLTLHVEGIRQN
ncbi:Protein YceI [Vibrio stylophorae]|uniref:Protein YceI n=1 Tax=Vibrio stylophorae TaxID=659351 RepID=A0ABM8ZQ84_9VIBR|nr:YceI family protein [Vibrio stylophorae]CAH0532462.1 Protein YceI [Vibrio stylophorae]